MVQSADGTPLGEAFVHFDDERSKVRLALAKDRSIIPVSVARGRGARRGGAGWMGAWVGGWRWVARAPPPALLLRCVCVRMRGGNMRHTQHACAHCAHPPHDHAPQTRGVPVEVLTAVEDDVTRRQYSGCVLV